MRSDLTAVEGVANVQTDVDANTCVFEYSPNLDIQAKLKQLSKANSKIEGFQVITGG